MTEIKIGCSTCRHYKFNNMGYACEYKKKGPCNYWTPSQADTRLWIEQHRQSVEAKLNKGE